MSDIGPVEQWMNESWRGRTGNPLVHFKDSEYDFARQHDAEDARKDEALRQAAEALRTCIEGFRLTREYVGEGLLPEIAGWSHFDAAEQARAALAALEVRG